MGKGIRCVVVGVGIAGSKMEQSHMQTYLEHPRCDLAGIIDTSEIQLSAALELWRPYTSEILASTSYKLLRAVQPEIISICVPEVSHVHVFWSVLKIWNPSAILMEKPLATTPGGCEQIVGECERRKITLGVNHQRAWDGDFRRMDPPGMIWHSGPPWRTDVHAHHLAQMLGARKIQGQESEDRALMVDGGIARGSGSVRRNTHAKAISDLITGIETGKEPECDGKAGTSAVLATLREREQRACTPVSG